MNVLDCFTKEEIEAFNAAAFELYSCGVLSGAKKDEANKTLLAQQELSYRLVKMIKKARQNPLKETA